jgi:hypothetical protein
MAAARGACNGRKCVPNEVGIRLCRETLIDLYDRIQGVLELPILRQDHLSRCVLCNYDA